jgi:hypothetical protein
MMNDQSVFEQINLQGYCLLPKSRPGILGYPEILFVLSALPPLEQCSLRSIRLWLAHGNGHRDCSALHLTEIARRTCHVCPGSVILQGWSDKRLEFCTFGGTLETATFLDETLCSLRSVAPILPINRTASGILDKLAFEAKAILDKQAAQWGRGDRNIVRRLCTIDPLQLYLATLQSMLNRFSQYQSLRPYYDDIYQVLLQEREWFSGTTQRPAAAPSLEEMLSPDHALH